MDEPSCLEDLNQLIKFFSYTIQERIEELGTTEIKSHTPTEDQVALITKYANSKIKDDKNIQCINKFSQRIMQVFSYFKSRSNHKNLLNLIQERLVTNIDLLISKVPIHLGNLIKLILAFVKTPFQIENCKKNTVELSMSSVKLKINPIQRSKVKVVTPSNPFMHLPSSVEARCFTSSAVGTKINDPLQKVDTRQLKTSVSGVHIRRHISQTSKSSISKRPKLQQQDLKCYNELDLDKRYINYVNQMVSSSLKEGQEKIQKQFLKRNENIRLNIQSYTRNFQYKVAPVSQARVLTEVTNKKSNTVQWSRKHKNGVRNSKCEVMQSKKEINPRNRAHTSLRQEVEQELCSNLFRQRRLRKLQQQNTLPRNSVVNVSIIAKNQSHVRVVKII